MTTSILSQLSSQTRDRTEYSNRRVVVQCLDDPDLLADIAEGLHHADPAIVGDCAEVFTHVATDHPEWISPYAQDLADVLVSKNTRVRWEAMHALSLIASLTPAVIGPLLPRLAEAMRSDPSVIVRDYATETLGGYASTSQGAAQAAYPLLKEMLNLWNGKQAGHALHAIALVAPNLPGMHPELRRIAEEFSRFPRPVVRKAAKDLLKAIR